MIQWNLKSSGAKAPCGFESAPGNGAFRSARVRFRGALAGRGVEHDQGNVEQGWRWSWFIDRRGRAFAEAGLADRRQSRRTVAPMQSLRPLRETLYAQAA